MSYPCLGDPARQACPTLPHVGRLVWVLQLPLAGAGCGHGRPGGAGSRYVDEGRLGVGIMVGDAMLSRRGRARGGRVRLRVRPLVIVVPDLGEAGRGGVVHPKCLLREHGTRVVRGGCAALALDELGWGGVARVTRGGGGGCLVIRAKRVAHCEESVRAKAVNERVDVGDELVEVLRGGPVGLLLPRCRVVEVTVPVEELAEEVLSCVWGRGVTGVFLADSGQVSGGIHVDIRVSHGDLDVVEPFYCLPQVNRCLQRHV